MGWLHCYNMLYKHFSCVRLASARADLQHSALPQIDHNVTREVVNHRALRHRNLVMFKRAILTPTHLAIVMELAKGARIRYYACVRVPQIYNLLRAC